MTRAAHKNWSFHAQTRAGKVNTKDKPKRHDRDPLEAGAVTSRHLGYAVKRIKPEQRAGDGYGQRGGAQETVLRGLRCGLHQCVACLKLTSTVIGNTNTADARASLFAHIP